MRFESEEQTLPDRAALSAGNRRKYC